MTIKTKFGVYQVTSLHLSDSGETYIIVNSDNVMKLNDGIEVGECVHKMSNDTLCDMYVLGNDESYIEQLETVIFGE